MLIRKINGQKSINGHPVVTSRFLGSPFAQTLSKNRNIIKQKAQTFTANTSANGQDAHLYLFYSFALFTKKMIAQCKKH